MRIVQRSKNSNKFSRCLTLLSTSSHRKLVSYIRSIIHTILIIIIQQQCTFYCSPISVLLLSSVSEKFLSSESKILSIISLLPTQSEISQHSYPFFLFKALFAHRSFHPSAKYNSVLYCSALRYR